MDAGGSKSRIPPGGVIGSSRDVLSGRVALRVRRFRGDGGISEPQGMHTADVVDAAKRV
jgi:hypothetical protein